MLYDNAISSMGSQQPNNVSGTGVSPYAPTTTKGGIATSLDTSIIYDSFMNGSNGINEKNAVYKLILAFGVAVNDAQKLTQNIIDALMTAAGDTYNQDGSINFNAHDNQAGTSYVDLNDISISITNPLTGKTQNASLNGAMDALNRLNNGIQSDYTIVYAKAMAKNPNLDLPKTLNLPTNVSTMTSDVTAIMKNGSVPDQGNLSPGDISSQDLNQLISGLANATSSYGNVGKNISLKASVMQQDINNAWKTLSSVLKFLISSMMTIMNNI